LGLATETLIFHFRSTFTRRLQWRKLALAVKLSIKVKNTRFYYEKMTAKSFK